MATIFDQYLQPVRTIGQRMAELDQQDIQREQLTGVRNQNQLQALAMQRDAQARAEAQRDQGMLQQLAGQAGGDQNALIRALRGSGRMALMSQADAIEKALLERQNKEAGTRKLEVEADKERLAIESKRAETVLQAVSAAKDPASYQQAIQWLSSQGVDTSKIPQQFDPNYVAQAGQMAMSAKERADQEWKAKGYDLDVRKQGETERQNKAQIAVQMRGQNMADARSREANQMTREANATIYDPERGVLVNKATGLARPAATMDGKPLGAKEKPLNDTQAKALLFGSRMQEADKAIEAMASKGVTQPSLIKKGAEAVPFIGSGLGMVANAVASPAQQQVEQAQRDFINAVLRRESGAAIAMEEFDNANKQYFPQPNDSKSVIEQKARNRKNAVKLMLAEVPAGTRVPNLESIGEPSAPSRPAAQPGKAPSVSNW